MKWIGGLPKQPARMMITIACFSRDKDLGGGVALSFVLLFHHSVGSGVEVPASYESADDHGCTTLLGMGERVPEGSL